MIKQEANNSFAEGMMMDLNPLMTPNTVMTNCLNGTLVTFNGNEYMLQNDMGNGRVETAYLPEGYIPMGTCELGGIIYIVSYNPLKGTCQIGSFPSPERNITSDEREGTTVVTLNNSDFKWVNSETGAGVYYLKKDLDSTLQFYPGDKFIVYSSNIVGNISKLNGLADDIKEETVRISLGTVTSDGKLVVFDEETLKKFKVSGEKKYHIKEHSGGSMAGTDIDEYRSLVEQPYNIFSSKVSGTLVLIAELVLFSQFSASVHHHFEGEDEDKTYVPTVDFEFSGNYKYVPYGVKVKLTLVDGLKGTEFSDEIEISQSELESNFDSQKSGGDFTDTLNHIVLDVDFIKGKSEILNNLPDDNYFGSSERDPFTLTYEFIPCMVWGPVSHLSIKGSIALDKVGSGYIGLSSWKYYNSDTKCNLTWGLEVYEEENKSVNGVSMEFTRLVSDTSTETITYDINKKNSYHGTFYELIPFESNYYKIKIKGTNEEAYLHSNSLYLVKIIVDYADEDPRVFYRWIYTNSVFNDYFYNTLDYSILELDMFQTTLDFSYKLKSEPKSDEYYGFLRGEKTEEITDVDKRVTLSAIKTYKKNTAECTAKVKLKKDYNTFRIHTNKDSLNLALDSADKHTFSVESKIKYTDREDGDMESILANEMLETFSNEDLPEDATSPTNASYEDFVGEEAKYGNALKVTTGSITKEYDENEDLFKFNINYDTVTIAKAYASLSNKNCSSRGKIEPLAYDNDTFADYDLQYYNSKWQPILLGTFGFKERGGRKGYAYVGYLNDGGLYDNQFREGNDVDFNWTGDNAIVGAEQLSGWNSSLMFVAHHCSAGANPQQLFFNKGVVKLTSKNGFVRNNNLFSRDSKWSTSGNIVLVAVKSNVDDYYYPLNCCMRASVSRTEDSQAYSSYINNWGNFYKEIAIVLNNLFKYVGESTIKPYLLPNYIYYGDDYTYTVNIAVVSSLNESKMGEILLKVNESTFVDIDEDLISRFDSSIPEDKLDDLIPNITTTVTDTIKDSSQLITNITKDTSSGITLRNHMLDQQVDDLGVIICGYDGNDSGKSSYNTFNTKTIYCMNNGEPEPATKFNPINLTYSGGGDNALVVTVPSSTTTLFDKTININKNFTLNDSGIMIAKDPPKSELNVKRDGDHDTGTVYGYQKRGLSPNYEFWS